jgi:hypothetical protein
LNRKPKSRGEVIETLTRWTFPPKGEGVDAASYRTQLQSKPDEELRALLGAAFLKHPAPLQASYIMIEVFGTSALRSHPPIPESWALYRQRLDAMSPDERQAEWLSALRGDEPDFAELEEAARAFNRPDAMLSDFHHWATEGFWDDHQISTLSLGRDPRKVTWKTLAPFRDASPFVQAFVDRQLKVIKAGSTRQLAVLGPGPHIIAKPIDVIEWAEVYGVPFPPQLVSAVRDLDARVRAHKAAANLPNNPGPVAVPAVPAVEQAPDRPQSQQPQPTAAAPTRGADKRDPAKLEKYTPKSPGPRLKFLNHEGLKDFFSALKPKAGEIQWEELTGRATDNGLVNVENAKVPGAGPAKHYDPEGVALWMLDGGKLPVTHANIYAAFLAGMKRSMREMSRENATAYDGKVTYWERVVGRTQDPFQAPSDD